MLRTVNIENSLVKKNISFYYKELYSNNSDFNITNDTFNKINGIDKNDEILILYVLYKIITENKIDPNSINPTPKRGLFFSDLKTKKSLGIYHCHLHDNMVLIWYLEKYSNGDFNLEIEYIQHPRSYDNILKHIYKNTDGWNLYTGKYFKDYINTTYLKDHFIQKWFNFIRNF